ncbi:hypothetical protein NBE98_13845 [Clostridium swellfunianum]|uniref:hypothetical protein n=1 Tax=Clostridium swellfunianum TaxID=1367462 RepID=UPI00202EB582|nr:hypothetical protein [Clostridium swellfunianum]MCM0649444.1 hypothetical protein [Clostridium swellfunianum]
MEVNSAKQKLKNADGQSSNQIEKSSATAALSSELVLVSSIINNLNTATAKRDDIYVIAATIGLIASYFSKIAANQEANEQQISPGVTTFANNLKLIATDLGLISAAISYWALLIEVALRAQGISAPQTGGPSGSSSVSSSLLVQ